MVWDLLHITIRFRGEQAAAQLPLWFPMAPSASCIWTLQTDPKHLLRVVV